MSTTKKTPPKNQLALLENALKTFGFSVGKGFDGHEITKTFAIPQMADGTVTIQAGGVYGHYVDVEGVAKGIIDLINRYREISNYPEVDGAIEEIVNNAIVVESNEPPVKLDLDKLENYSDDFKEILYKEFEGILNLPGFDFKNNGHEIFRRWYVDGRIYYHIMIDTTAPRKGIQELRYIDPRRLRKVREIQKKPNANGHEEITGMIEYYVYNERGIGTNSQFIQSTGMSFQGIKVSPDSIADCDSGISDSHRNMILSYLHKAIRAVNQLRMIEDAVIIYKMSRAPERRIFYVDVGDLPPAKATAFVNDLMLKYRNKTVYDANTGEIRDDKKFLSMMEDFWMPRRNGSSATTIDTLSGDKGFTDIDELQYFLERVMKSMNVPLSRLRSDSGFQIGRPSEISNEERKFNKFVVRIRRRFSMLFTKLLKIQLVLKGIVTLDEWTEKIEPYLDYNYLKDSYYAELEDTEILMNRVATVTQMQELIGIYYPISWVKKNVLKQTEEEIDDLAKEMAKEAKQPVQLPQSAQIQLETQKQLMDSENENQKDILGTQADIEGDAAKQQANLQMKMQAKQAEMAQNQQLQTMMTQAQLQQRETQNKPKTGKK